MIEQFRVSYLSVDIKFSVWANIRYANIPVLIVAGTAF